MEEIGEKKIEDKEMKAGGPQVAPPVLCAASSWEVPDRLLLRGSLGMAVAVGAMNRITRGNRASAQRTISGVIAASPVRSWRTLPSWHGSPRSA